MNDEVLKQRIKEIADRIAAADQLVVESVSVTPLEVKVTITSDSKSGIWAWCSTDRQALTDEEIVTAYATHVIRGSVERLKRELKATGTCYGG